MANKPKNNFVQGSLFEENYLIRTLGSLGYSPDVALTELVANAWDAGATKVNIAIPDTTGQKLIIEDNGIGLTKEQFHSRWMKLGYDRIKHQGKNVIFPNGVEGKRIAYGRNGIGRHGLLCFNNDYSVVTHSKGEKCEFVVTTLSESQPFVIKSEASSVSDKHGTTLEVIVEKHLPKAEDIFNIISARFLHDPQFVVSINNRKVDLEDHAGLIDEKEIKVGSITLHAFFIDSQKANKSTIYQGIAFWQGNRLVGVPSWVLGNMAVIDGRMKFAKRYTVVVKSNDLADLIYEDWTGFKNVEVMDKIYTKVSEYVNDMFSTIAKESIEETKEQIKNEFSQEYSGLSALGKYEVNEAIEAITIAHPTAKPETVSIAVEAIINLEKTRSGKELLLKLTKLTEDDIDGLNNLLEKWSVKDALVVLNEIDNRISIIEAIRKLSGDDSVDELHVLHPLVTDARWLFGPEFESAEYSSNRQLQTAVETVFKTKIQKDVFNNHRKRPDIVVLPEATLSVTGTEIFDNESTLSIVNRVLLIELKKGGLTLGRDERNQAQGYVEDFIGCGSLIGNPYIDAFVVGTTFKEKVQPITTVSNENKVEMGKVRICTFGQLVDTAEKRLFGLRKKLSERYDDLPGMQLFKQVNSIQLSANFEEKP